jgi:hypothetical protein
LFQSKTAANTGLAAVFGDALNGGLLHFANDFLQALQ